MLKTKIKAGSITNLTDARYFAAREVEWLGFDLSPGSEAYVPAAQMLAIKEWVDGVKIVGEFNLEPAADILAAVETLALDAVQLGMVAEEATIRELAPVVAVICEVVPDYYQSDEDLRELFSSVPDGPAFFLLNLAKNGFTWQDLKAGTPFSMEALRTLCRDYPVLLALNFEPGEVLEILDELPVRGLHLLGGEEERVGFKSFDELDEILDRLEV